MVFMNELPIECLQILFWFVAVPGVKSVSFLRALMKQGRGSVQNTNLQIVAFIEKLVEAGYLKEVLTCYNSVSGVSKRKFKLKHEFKLTELRQLATRAEMNDWWPSEEFTKGFGVLSGANSPLNADKEWYVGRSRIIYAISQGLRRLLIGHVELPDAECQQEAGPSLAHHYVGLLANGEDFVDVVDRDHIQLRVLVGIIAVAFANGREIRNSLANLVAYATRHAARLQPLDAVELAAMCVWTGQLALVERIFECDWINRQTIMALNAIRRLGDNDESSFISLWAPLQDFIQSQEGSYKSLAYRLGLQLLALAAAVRVGMGKHILGEIVTAGGESPCDYNLTCDNPYPGTIEALAMFDIFESIGYLTDCVGQSDYWSTAFHLNSHNLPFYYVNAMKAVPQLLLFARHDFPKDVKSKIAGNLMAWQSAISGIADSGYPTIVALFVSLLHENVENRIVNTLVAKIEADNGIWLWPRKSVEALWPKALEAIGKALVEHNRAGKGKKKQKKAIGKFVWGIDLLSLNRFNSENRDYVLDGITPGFQRSATEAEDAINEMSLREAQYSKYDECRTSLDEALIREASFFTGPWHNSSKVKSIVDKLIECGNVAILTESREKFFYGHKRKHDFQIIDFLRGNVAVKVERKADGSFELSLPGWCEEWMQLNHIVRKEGDRKYKFYEITPEHQNVFSVFKQFGSYGRLIVPKEASEKVDELISRINASGFISVEGDEAIDVLAAKGELKVVEGDSTPVMRLSLGDHGKLDLSLGVVLYAGAEFLTLGSGNNESEIVWINGERVLLKRDAEKELAQYESIYGVLIKAGVEEIGVMHWRTSDLNCSLNTLLALKDLGDMLRLEWPDGRRISVSDFKPDVLLTDKRTERGWFEVKGEFKFDSDIVMSIVQMIDALDSHTGDFVRLTDGQFVRLTESMRRRLEALKASGKKSKGAVEIAPAAVPALSRVFDETDGKLPSALRESALKFAAAFEKCYEVPRSLNATLREYQREGFEWMSRHAECGFGCCLADDMGLGKTVQTIALLLSRAGLGPSLVVAPASVCGNWLQELHRFAPSLNTLTSLDIQSTTIQPSTFCLQPTIVIVSYNYLSFHVKELTAVDWNVVVLDEAQAIKNFTSLRARSVKELRAKALVAATGTPVENRLSELWSLFDFLNPGLLGSIKTFAERLTKDGMATDALKRLVAPFILRRLKGDVLKELPAKTEITIPIELPSAERTAYEGCRVHALEALAYAQDNRIAILAELMRLRRFCCHPSLVIKSFKDSAKLAALQELLASLKDAGHRALVFSQFTDYLTIVRELVEKNGWTYQYLDGTTPIGLRTKRVAAFQAGEGDFFLISLKAGGTGLNLTAANYVILLDPWWNPAVENQAADRVHRIGQQNPVTVYRLIALNTVEEKVIELHREKLAMSTDLLDAASTKLTPAQLLSLFK